MTPTKGKQTPLGLSIAIPTSFIDVYQNKAQKTQQIGRIARALAIFQVDEIILYCDRKKQTKNLHFISQILEYMETPQYLRKHLFGRLPELQYVGLLPPLRTPHHPLAKKATDLKNGEIREGVAFEKQRKQVVDVGVETPLPLLQSQPVQSSRRITVQIRRNKSGKLITIPYSFHQPKQYWGYSVTSVDSSLGEFLTNTTKYRLTIATSRKAAPLEDQVSQIRTQWQKQNRLLLLFGSHKEGLPEILQRENLNMAAIANHSVNLVFNQGTATIRTEEAVLIGLTAFRFFERNNP